MNRIRLVLVDDQKLFVDNLKIVLEARTDDILVLGVAYDGREAVGMVAELAPDIVLMDVRMPGMDGVQAARAIHEKAPGTKVIMLTTFSDDRYVKDAVRYGAVGYVLKSTSPEELIGAVRAVQGGAFLVPQPAATSLFGGAEEDTPEGVEDESLLRRLAELTNREKEILGLVARAYDNGEISEKLFIAEQTVKNYLSALYAKLGVSKRTQLMKAVKAARRKGFFV